MSDFSSRCARAGEVAAGFLEWLAAGDVPNANATSEDVHRVARAVNTLAAASTGRMTVAVYGPSQHGKSYLISALGKNEKGQLLARFGDKTYDFLKELNPEGERESTGVVSRFTTQRPPDAVVSGRSVQLRLLNELDVIKILANTFFGDVEAAAIDEVTGAEVSAATQGAQQAQRGEEDHRISASDLRDLRDYLEETFPNAPRINALGRMGYWEAAGQAIGSLGPSARVQLFSTLWAGTAELTNLYSLLQRALLALGAGADTVFCGVEALVPRETSIIDVETLFGLRAPADTGLMVAARNGSPRQITRAALAALTAELIVPVELASAGSLLNQVDLLDFPGARSRGGIKHLESYFASTPRGPEELFRRGKMSYLFDRYSQRQELASLAVCVKGGVQEVTTLPHTIANWIAASHGATAQDRDVTCGRIQEVTGRGDTTLFLVLTQCDREFEIKAGESATPENKWRIRIDSSILSYFAKSHDWPRRWLSARGFQNTYLLRNPAIKALALFDFEGDREVRVRREQADRVERFAQAFVSTAEVASFFRDPPAAWGAMLTLNDGGVSYLAESLAQVCRSNVRDIMLDRQLEAVQGRLTTLLRPFYVDEDEERQQRLRRERLARLNQAIFRCIQRSRFGDLLWQLQLRDDDLVVSLRSWLGRSGLVRSATTIPQAMPEGFWDEIPGLDQLTVAQQDPATDQASAILDLWSRNLSALARSEAWAAHLQVDPPELALLVEELLLGADRLDLRGQIATALRAESTIGSRSAETAHRAARIVASCVNGYVNSLDSSTAPAAATPSAGSAGAPLRARMAGQPRVAWHLLFGRDWLRAFAALAEKNTVLGLSGKTNAERNAKIRALLARLQ